ncbi:polysaccharide lyase 8 family protein [Listeria grandensis]|uniref:Polysaccharide lyase 8 family protein n=2 Tax=Listeria grandensis TaxID=1494963 RepID=A0A7X0Y2Z9_9LIST|nr:polysaccharide lyase 8 family protein [Listeria grandensis]MBC1473917.1 polysaccharide lyase 8 family protein [Listeria grandensis]MBC1936065.1 polysaccharide lyase 8 family protein [Listeria grandensis]
MKKYWITFFLVLSLLLVNGEKTSAQTVAEQNTSLNNWKISLTGKAFPNSNTALKLTLAENERSMQQAVLSRLNKDPKKNYLFSNVTAWKTNSTQITITATNIEKMATLYQTPNSIYYRNAAFKQDILYSLQWFYSHIYNEKVTNAYGNWYDWQIGTPISLVNSLALMKAEIPSAQLQSYLKAIDRFAPATASDRYIGTGANRINKGFIVTMRGVIGGNQAKINLGAEIVKRVYTPVTSGDGFYADGSFIQHTNTPYTTGYGAEILARSADFYQLLAGTKTLSGFKSLPTVFTYLDTTYLPVLYKDEVLDMTRGRGASLKAISNQQVAQTMLYDMFTISQKNTNASYRGKYANITKSSIISQSLKADFYKNLTVAQAQSFQMVLLNKNIPATYPNRTQNKMMAGASQMIDFKPNYVAGLSMFSKRISAFESIAGQNKLGFYTGTGALYLYNGDEAFEGNYYPTVDMTSLAGTTTDHKTRPITSDNAKYLNPQAWSGGVSDLQNGAATMHYSMKNVTGSSLEARKSWFFLNGKIVALGAGITSKENLNTETIVENRKLLNTNLNSFIVGGQTINLGQTKTSTNTKWAYLNGVAPSQSIGYVFPTATTVTAYKKTRYGNWNTLNIRNASSPVSANYAGITISHGRKPVNKSYSYILLPGKSKQATEAYSKKIDVEIRANNLNQQAVFDKSQNLWIGNFRQPGTVNGFVGQTRGSIMVRKTATSEKVTLADPTMEQTKIIFLVPKMTGHKLKSKSPEVSVTTSGKNWRIQVNTAAKNGKSFSVLFGK